MLLLVDAGNTRIKWALSAAPAALNAEKGWLRTGAVLHADVDSLADRWHGLLAGRVVISNVAGPAIGERLAGICCAAGMPKPEWFASVPALAGVRNGYREPSQLGSDRFAAMIGARSLYPDQPLVIATCGTATTIDALSAEGDFVGGMILPGLGLMARSLAGNTAQLPQVVSEMALTGLFTDHTEAAIASGCLAAQAGAIDRAFQQHAASSTTGQQPVRFADIRCILSGGAAQLIAAHVTSPYRHVDNLVLTGLATAAFSTTPC
jgi:type III pantothenate kinase